MIIQKLKNIYHQIQCLQANVKFDFPARDLIIIGVTGTDGKTTTVNMIYHILKTNNFKVAMISTISAIIADDEIDTGLHVTTPEPWDLPRLLSLAYKQGIEYIVLESTSSGLDQNRLCCVKYDAAIITNIGWDHIDYHKTWKNYAKAKFKIVQKTKKEGLIVLNKDNQQSAKWLNKKVQKISEKEIKWITLSKDLRDIKHTIKGIEFYYKNTKFNIPILGEYNFQNALGVIKICERYISVEKIAEAFQTFRAPKGRMEVMQQEPFTVIIDFAHTPTSLERALDSISKIKPNKDSKIITVFGCAGQRDPERRKMGAISVKYSDLTILTLEDPRNEKVKIINNKIIEYAEKDGGRLIKRFENGIDYVEFTKKGIKPIDSKSIISFDYDEVQNRKDAITLACKIAKNGDIVFITGKGHEQSLGIGNPVIEYPYSDQDTVKEALSIEM